MDKDRTLETIVKLASDWATWKGERTDEQKKSYVLGIYAMALVCVGKKVADEILRATGEAVGVKPS